MYPNVFNLVQGFEMWPKERKRGRKRLFDGLDVPDKIVQTDENDNDPDHNNHACGLHKSQVFLPTS